MILATRKRIFVILAPSRPPADPFPPGFFLLGFPPGLADGWNVGSYVPGWMERSSWVFPPGFCSWVFPPGFCSWVLLLGFSSWVFPPGFFLLPNLAGRAFPGTEKTE